MKCLGGLLAVFAVAAGCGRTAPIDDEARARDTYVRALADREGLLDVWSLMSRSTIDFEDGLSAIEMIDPEAPSVGWREVARPVATGMAQPVRWMAARSHLRVRGESSMRLTIYGRADLVQIGTRPLVAASLDGAEFYSALPDDDGYFRIDATIPQAKLASWADIYVTLSSVNEPWRDLSRLHVARIERVVWEPAVP